MFVYVWDTTSVHAVPVFHQEAEKYGTSGACGVSEEYTAVEVSLIDQEKKASLAKGQQEFEAYYAKNDKSRSKVGGNGGATGSEVIPSKFSSEFAATSDPQTRLGGKVLANSTDVFDFGSDQSEWAASRPAVLEGGKEKTVDQVSEVESEQVKLNAKVLYSKEQAGKTRADEEYMMAELVVEGAYRKTLSDELT